MYAVFLNSLAANIESAGASSLGSPHPAQIEVEAEVEGNHKYNVTNCFQADWQANWVGFRED